MDMHELVSIEDAGPGAPRYTTDGYVTANVRAARVGIQVYRGSELGRPDLETVRVYRSEDEVFSKDSLSTYAHRPLTNDHPPEPVHAENWKKFSVGMVGDEVARDGDFVRVPMVLMDKTAIKDFEAGKKQLSLGYTTELKWEPGVTKDGQQYDALQTKIRANHLAMVTAARGGPMLKIGDAIKQEKQMKTIMVDGLPVQTDDAGETIVNRVVADKAKKIETLTADVDTLRKQLADAETKLATAQAETKKVTETKDAELDVLKKQVADSAVTPAKLDALVKDRAEVVAKAKAVLADKLIVDGKTVEEIKKQVVDAKMGDTAKNYSADAYAASFAALTADVKTDEVTDGLADALNHQVRGVTNVSDADKAYDEMTKGLEAAWKNKAA